MTCDQSVFLDILRRWSARVAGGDAEGLYSKGPNVQDKERGTARRPLLAAEGDCRQLAR